jgi:hypothetical protein
MSRLTWAPERASSPSPHKSGTEENGLPGEWDADVAEEHHKKYERKAEMGQLGAANVQANGALTVHSDTADGRVDYIRAKDSPCALPDGLRQKSVPHWWGSI